MKKSKTKKEKKPNEMTDKELCRAFRDLDKHLCNDDASHSYSYEYSMLGELSNEMTKRGFTEERNYEFLNKDGDQINY